MSTDTTLYCECDAPVMDVEHDAGCRRCGRPVNFNATEVPIAIPYGLHANDLSIDPGSKDISPGYIHGLLNELALRWSAEEVERVFASTVLLKSTCGDASLAQCLDTAMTWERG